MSGCACLACPGMMPFSALMNMLKCRIFWMSSGASMPISVAVTLDVHWNIHNQSSEILPEGTIARSYRKIVKSEAWGVLYLWELQWRGSLAFWHSSKWQDKTSNNFLQAGHEWWCWSIPWSLLMQMPQHIIFRLDQGNNHYTYHDDGDTRKSSTIEKRNIVF